MSAVQKMLGFGSYFFKPCRILQQVLHHLLGNVDFVLVSKDEANEVFQWCHSVQYRARVVSGPYATAAAQYTQCGFYDTNLTLANFPIFTASLFRTDDVVSHGAFKIA